MVHYTPVHYMLIGLSVLVMSSFFAAIAYLIFREKQKGKLARKQHLKTLLQKRRKAISGRPRGPEVSFSDESTAEWHSTTPPFSPRSAYATRSTDIGGDTAAIPMEL
ncbi:hypothetical protein Btru_053163 [Bulinus truncatus]|nr:hypothetical protein Btru_053163 [Bulinus truncatus]